MCDSVGIPVLQGREDVKGSHVAQSLRPVSSARLACLARFAPDRSVATDPVDYCSWLFIGCGNVIRTHDLQGMNLTHYQTVLSRIVIFICGQCRCCCRHWPQTTKPSSWLAG